MFDASEMLKKKHSTDPGQPKTSAPMFASCLAFIQKLYWGIAESMPHECLESIKNVVLTKLKPL